MQINNVFIGGNLTKDPVKQYTQAGDCVVNFTLAINRKYKTKAGQVKDEVVFISVIAWSRNAEIVAEYLLKGSPVIVEGRLTQERWEDKETGKVNTKTRVYANRVHLVGKKPQQESCQAGEAADQPVEAW